MARSLAILVRLRTERPIPEQSRWRTIHTKDVVERSRETVGTESKNVPHNGRENLERQLSGYVGARGLRVSYQGVAVFQASASEPRRTGDCGRKRP